MDFRDGFDIVLGSFRRVVPSSASVRCGWLFWRRHDALFVSRCVCLLSFGTVASHECSLGPTQFPMISGAASSSQEFSRDDCLSKMDRLEW